MEKPDKSVADEIRQQWPNISRHLSTVPSQHRGEFMDNKLADAAHKAMCEKLALSRKKGRGGWWQSECSTELLKDMLKEHIEKGDMRDVLNLAAMIYFREAAEIEDTK
tara:strand:+ start:1337 stop:1660 length:324 start_codon:yes stop_codon:yes gene_type:complete